MSAELHSSPREDHCCPGCNTPFGDPDLRDAHLRTTALCRGDLLRKRRRLQRNERFRRVDGDHGDDSAERGETAGEEAATSPGRAPRPNGRAAQAGAASSENMGAFSYLAGPTFTGGARVGRQVRGLAPRAQRHLPDAFAPQWAVLAPLGPTSVSHARCQDGLAAPATEGRLWLFPACPVHHSPPSTAQTRSRIHPTRPTLTIFSQTTAQYLELEMTHGCRHLAVFPSKPL